jgi:hypothetical protein
MTPAVTGFRLEGNTIKGSSGTPVEKTIRITAVDEKGTKSEPKPYDLVIAPKPVRILTSSLEKAYENHCCPRQSRTVVASAEIRQFIGRILAI